MIKSRFIKHPPSDTAVLVCLNYNTMVLVCQPSSLRNAKYIYWLYYQNCAIIPLTNALHPNPFRYPYEQPAVAGSSPASSSIRKRMHILCIRFFSCFYWRCKLICKLPLGASIMIQGTVNLCAVPWFREYFLLLEKSKTIITIIYNKIYIKILFFYY